MTDNHSILSAEQFSREELDHFLNVTFRVESHLQKEKSLPLLQGYILCSLFFEASTRTRLSFETAMLRLGGKIITSVGFQFSSLSKGESLYDTLKVVESYADVCTIRHSDEGVSQLAAKNLKIPVINAGDGAGEHPTQALLDLYTINKYQAIQDKKLVVAFVGDMKYGRTIHSLYKLLVHYNIEFIFISPSNLCLPDKDKEYLKKSNASFQETENISAIFEADVAYITRIQSERFSDPKEYSKYANVYIIDKKIVTKCKPNMIIMHPLPRVNEISLDIDDMPNAVYFEQVKYGVYARITMLLYALGISW